MTRPSLPERLSLRYAERAAAQGLRRLRVAERGDGRWLLLEGRRLLSFASNDYLGLAGHAAVRAALVECARRDGVGATAAHLLGGHGREHERLEAECAEWLGRPRALLFSSGYAANLGVLSALLGPEDVCVQDRLNHASLLDGARLAGCELKRYRHADVDSARRQLESRSDAGALLASDGVFSMDGDIAPLRGLATMCREQGATLMVDDAHGIGVLGPGGAGSVADAGLDHADVPVLMLTLGKALGVAGAIVAGDAALIDGLLQFARTYVYTTALPPALAAATRAALAIARHEHWRRDHLGVLIRHFRRGAAQRGLTLARSDTPIQPIILGESAAALALAAELERRGFHVPAIRAPTVPRGQARLRVTLSALHREDEVEALLDAVAAAMATLEREPETGAASSAGKGARRSRAGRVRQQRPDPARGRA
jgi:8-amino-7-oxononanoate synthase